MSRKTLIRIGVLVLLVVGGCDSRDRELLSASVNPERRPIDVSRVGVNNFFVDPEFGSIRDQFLEIRDTLGLRHVRVLIAWTDEVQRVPDRAPFVGFFDEIVRAIPPGLDVIFVVAHSPSWMADPSNWIDGNPRVTWVRRWFSPIVRRYAGVRGIVGWEVFNEPDLLLVPADAILGLDDPDNYFELLQLSSEVVRTFDPTRLVLVAATASINQNFPNALNYNKRLRDLGAESLVDIWNIHYYGTSYERVVVRDGVRDFLNSLRLPVWVTESGRTGPTNQLEYVERTWPFLIEQIPRIERIYYYEFGSPVSLENNFGLRTTDSALPVSDLYLHLMDRRG